MKNARHQQILNRIRQKDIETQEELAEQLNASGFSVTQATVSRDIRQLQLHKVHLPDGRQKYAQVSENGSDLGIRYHRILRDAFVSIDISGNIAVIHTISGMAMAAALSLDSMDWAEVLGCVAGDDTILTVLRSPEDAAGLRSRLAELLKE